MSNVRPDDGQAPSFVYGLDPTSYLLAPADPEHPEDPLTVFHEAIDYLDPGSWVLAIISKLCGSNPVEDAMERLAGDWRSYGRVADMFGHLGKFFQAIGVNIKSGNDELDGFWGGQAADAAWIHFDLLAQRCVAHTAVLEQMQHNYETAENGAYHFAQLASPLAAALIDAAIVAGVAIAAGTATSETLIGGGIGYGVAAYEAWEMMEACDKLLRLISATDSALQGVLGELRTVVGTSGDVVAGFSKITLQNNYAPALPGGG